MLVQQSSQTSSLRLYFSVKKELFGQMIID